MRVLQSPLVELGSFASSNRKLKGVCKVTLFSIRNSFAILAVSLFMLCATRAAHAQISPGSLSFSIDGRSASNGYSGGGTGTQIAAGTQLTGTVSVSGVSGNNGTTTVQCNAGQGSDWYDQSEQISYWSTSQDGENTFSWTPSSNGTYYLWCSGTWTGAYVNGTVDTSDSPIIVPVLTPPTSIQGFINPKYVVVGVTYAPPDSSSNVQYTGTASVGNTTTISSSFSAGVGFSVSIQASIKGWGASGSVTGTSSTDYTQGSNSSITTTLSKLTSLSYRTNGTGDAFSPVDSDYDTIWLWLNPVAVLTYTPATSNSVAGIQWNGYGYDVNDPSGTAATGCVSRPSRIPQWRLRK